MATSKQSSNGHGSSKRVLPTNSLFVKVKYNNTLPDIPFDPKFLVNPLSLSRFVDYKTTSLEQNSKHELLTPMDLGVDIDLILPERYAIPDHPAHDPEDERLINDDEPSLFAKGARGKPHSQLHNKVVPWLKKTEYISTEYNRYGASNEKTETKVGYNVRKNMREEEIFLDRESQIKAINSTFEAAKKPIDKHPTKEGVMAKRVLPIYPDYELWRNYFVHVKFDSEPADSSKADQMSQAIIRGARDEETDENFVVYFLPTEITMADRLLDKNNGLVYSEGKEYEYKSTREYNVALKQNNHSDDYFFVIRDDCVNYNRFSLDVTLKKRRAKNQQTTLKTLVVSNRPPLDEEVKCEEDKMELLRKPMPPSPEPPMQDLTAQSLEQAYEEQEQTTKPAGDDVHMSDNESKKNSSSSESSESSASSSGAESSSSGEDESEADSDEDDEE